MAPTFQLTYLNEFLSKLFIVARSINFEQQSGNLWTEIDFNTCHLAPIFIIGFGWTRSLIGSLITSCYANTYLSALLHLWCYLFYCRMFLESVAVQFLHYFCNMFQLCLLWKAPKIRLAWWRFFVVMQIGYFIQSRYKKLSILTYSLIHANLCSYVTF